VDTDLVSEDVVKILTPERLQRMIGVIYEKDRERESHYVLSCLPQQFDCVIHMDTTRRIQPLDKGYFYFYARGC